MKERVIMPLNTGGKPLGLVIALGLLGMAFGLSAMLEHQRLTKPNGERPVPVSEEAIPAGAATRGYRLFDHNCAQCHGEDARGDEGPSLHNLKRSNERIAAIIKEGIKGEMPAFARKFTDTDVRSLIAFLRTLKE